jgi:hypothetical protein
MSANEREITEGRSWDVTGSTSAESADGSAGQTADGSNTEQEQSGTEPAPKGWWKATVLTLVALPFIMILAILSAYMWSQTGSSSYGGLAGILLLLLFILRLVLPISIYFDSKSVNNSDHITGGPMVWPYVLSSLMAPPPMELLVSTAYVHRRKQYGELADA